MSVGVSVGMGASVRVVASVCVGVSVSMGVTVCACLHVYGVCRTAFSSPCAPSISLPALMSCLLPPCSGVLLISLALCADAAIGNVQEKAMKEHLATNREVVSCCMKEGRVGVKGGGEGGTVKW